MKYNLFDRSKKCLHVIDTHKFLEEQQAEKKRAEIQGKDKSYTEKSESRIGDFTRPELLYLNKKPKMEYLKKEKPLSKYKSRKINYFNIKDKKSIGIPRRNEKASK